MYNRPLIEMKENTRANLIRIMLVDDHPLFRDGLSAIINAQPDMVVVAEAGSGEQSIELFRLYTPDVTVMDLRMPGIGGMEAITKIRKEYPSSRFVVLTTYDTTEDVYKTLQAGVQAYLLKETNREQVLEAIKSVHNGLKHIQASVVKRMAEHVSHPPLTPRELEVIKLIAKGKGNKEIATALETTEGTVKWYVRNIFTKLEVSDRAGAVNTAIQRRLIEA